MAFKIISSIVNGVMGGLKGALQGSANLASTVVVSVKNLAITSLKVLERLGLVIPGMLVSLFLFKA